LILLIVAPAVNTSFLKEGYSLLLRKLEKNKEYVPKILEDKFKITLGIK